MTPLPDAGPLAAGEPLLLADEAATAALGTRIGAELGPGDLVALHGEVGAGKTTLARAILRAHMDDPELEAPSPTFTLVQSYESGGASVIHADLYRVGAEEELVELGAEEWRDGAALIVEWPDRAPALLDRPRLDVALSFDPESGGRHATLSGASPLLGRLARRAALARMLEGSGWAGAGRETIQGDASTRLYERLVKPGGETAVLMVAPAQPDGPPVRRGKPYSAIARLAESVHAFAAMDRALVREGVSAPRILAEDLDHGLLLIEDLGSEPFVSGERPIVERYTEAVRLLAALHGRDLPEALPVSADRTREVPPYDEEAMLIEVELLLDWYLPHIAGIDPSGSVRSEFVGTWREVLAPLLSAPKTWTLRDYHSPNLIWLPRRMGLARVGVLDFQDAVLGPPAYDVVSLGQDARVTVPPEVELKLLGAYLAARRGTDPAFDMGAFATAYAIMGAQRATKILGIFARLDRRDGKPAYLRHLPRIRTYLARNLAHPDLARLKAWFERHLAADFGPAPPPEAAAEPLLDAGLVEDEAL